MKNFLTLIILFALAACAGEGKPNAPSDKPPKPQVVKTDHLICPQVAIVEQDQETFDYGGEKPEPSQLVAKALMKSIEGNCAYRTKTDDQASGIDITFTLHMVSSRGPRLGGLQVSFPHFVAIVDPADNVISRETMTAQFTFSASDRVAATDVPLHVFIPMPDQELVAGPDYRVLVGFHSSSSQR